MKFFTAVLQSIILTAVLIFPVSGIAQTTFSQEKVITTTQADGVSDLLIFNADGQGEAEIVTLNTGDEGIYYFQNLGDMNFNTALSIVTRIRGISSMTAGIVDDSGVDVYSGSSQNGILVHDNNGSGGFGLFVIQESLNDNYNNPRSLSLSDIDNDGNMDLLFVEPINNISSNIHIIFSVGDSRADSYEKFLLGGVNGLAATDVISGDVDGDGLSDIIVGSFGSGDLDWVKNNGSRNFGSPVEINAFLSGFRNVLGADYDDDNDLDLFVLRDDRVMYLQNNGSGSFSEPLNISFLSSASDMALGDIDNDGHLDVTVSDASTVSWARNNGSGGFDSVTDIYTSGASAVAVGDLRGDGDLDVVVGVGSENKILLFENYKLGPSNQPPVANDDTYSAEQGVEVTVSAENGVLSNDSDPNGSSLSFSLLTLPANGDLDVTQEGGFTYISDPDFTGLDSFSYSVSDPQGATETAKVTLVVVPAKPYAKGDTITINGSFQFMETGNVIQAIPWRLNNLDGAGTGFEIIANGRDDDRRAIQINISDTFNQGNDYDVEVVNEQISLVENDIYELSLWLKADSDSRIANIYMGLPESGGYYRMYDLILPVSTTWQKYTFQYQAEAESAEMGIRFGASFNFEENTGATFVMDGLSVTKISDTSSFVSPPYKRGAEITFNGSFEESALGVTRFLVPWLLNNANGANASYELISDAQDNDDRALMVNLSTAYNGGLDWNVEAVHENISVKEGDSYDISVWVKADSDSRTANIYLGFPESGGYIRQFQDRVDLNTEWTEYTYTYAADEEAETNGVRMAVSMNFEENSGATIYVDNLTITKSEASTSNESESGKPVSFALNQNYPNPFNPGTNIGFQLPEASEVTLKVFDMLGREVAALLTNARMSTGAHTVTFDASNLPSGIYLYQLETGVLSQTRKMSLIK